MIIQVCLLMALTSPAAQPATVDDEQHQASEAAWRALFDRTAVNYKFYRDREHTRRLHLHANPVYKLADADADAGRVYGAVYLWMYSGCPEVIAELSRSVNGDRISLRHELRSLSPKVLGAAGVARQVWKPAYGLARQPLDPAPPPAATAPARMAQIRTFANSFAAHVDAADGERRDLLRLGEPLWRYESTDHNVIDGALFAFERVEGTGLEALLLIEARRTSDEPRWFYAVGRFSDLDTFVSYDGVQIWKSVRGPGETTSYNADNTYLLVTERLRREPEMADFVNRPAARSRASKSRSYLP